MTLRTRLWSAAAALTLLAGIIYIAVTSGTVKGNAHGDSLFPEKRPFISGTTTRD